MDSILNTIKKKLGMDEEYDVYDIDIMDAINMALMNLTMIGVGNPNGFRISSSLETWEDFIEDQRIDIEGVKTYVYIKTRIIFDPPSNSFVLDSLEKNADKLEWLLNVATDRGDI